MSSDEKMGRELSARELIDERVREFERRKQEGTKPTNPKDLLGMSKLPMSCVPMPVVAEVGVAMLEGALKYGRFNWRAMGVRASIYFDATHRHLMSWWEGEDTDPDSQLSHITKAITSLMVLRDSMIQGNFVDDRPPSSAQFIGWLNLRTSQLVKAASERETSPHHFTIRDSTFNRRLSEPMGEVVLRDAYKKEPSIQGGTSYPRREGER